MKPDAHATAAARPAEQAFALTFRAATGWVAGNVLLPTDAHIEDMRNLVYWLCTTMEGLEAVESDETLSSLLNRLDALKVALEVLQDERRQARQAAKGDEAP